GSLATELSEALQESRLSRLEKSLRKFDLLIIDELSYLTFNRSQSELLFQVISERSERASVIITTNLDFSQWTQLFENEMMVAALVDRVTFNSQILNMNCTTSYRMETGAERAAAAPHIAPFHRSLRSLKNGAMCVWQYF
ncbi:MAG: ATP-binding protein, partial [Oscillospiraceae bacterium]|nr:ATP-binding protein [Oscillospiraceae bacterium]